MILKAFAAAIVVFTPLGASQSFGQVLPTPTAAPAAAIQAVRRVVADFGKQLRSVSVLAPPADVAAGMQKAYAAFVTPDLLESWKRAPLNAPGKRASSPSPERIDIDTIAAMGRDAFTVVGKVILLTDQERRNGGIFQANPVTMTVVHRKGKWLISNYVEKEARQ